MNPVQAASEAANAMRDIDSTARAVIAGVKEMIRDPAFSQVCGPVREATVDAAMRLESILNRKI